MNKNTYFSFAMGVGTQSGSGEWLEVYYPAPLISPNSKLIACVKQTLNIATGNQVIAPSASQLNQLANALTELGMTEQAALAQQLSKSQRPTAIILLETDEAPQSTPEIYLKLQLLSHRLLQPHQVDLTGIFGKLPNVAWTSAGAIAVDELAQKQFEARLRGELLEVMAVDKFPKMANYVIPSGVRIADTDRVRLGAYLGEGTTVMHEGFINFNAGTKGASMVEGRISAGVMVGNGTDLGGGCSTMGTLSGGNSIVISVGEECLIGANAGIGIPLGDRCTVEAGLYVTAGSKVALLDDKNQLVKIIKARDLAGKSDLLLRRNSENGRIECKTNKSAIALNQELHAHN
ncbi:MAG: 2,3,4,5-tetrahydropyridine-2,6-dicarboxylate N-succinyltransferase [Pseudomonadales bacterium]|nr:2,3,4,5-tetrahydropyridine-2,6-dicarboxylate N-succinyltransferase [Pseudomonadales bacterium]MCP5214212.1 2,3,4,5-tetrahydropyridine-2,6-dicarboxylate N-succinyltransferase [Pseudomonadales bacterium]